MTDLPFDPIGHARNLGCSLTEPQAEELGRLFAKKQRQGYEGRHYMEALHSFLLLVRQAQGLDEAVIRPHSYRVISAWNEGDEERSDEAVIHYRLPEKPEEVLMEAAEGVGPVDALHAALRKMLASLPGNTEFHLTDYHADDLDPQAEAAARVIVKIATHNGKQTILTVGIHANVITASWLALLDAMTVAVRNLRPADMGQP